MTSDKNRISWERVREVVAPLFGKECCRQRVGRYNSLSLGFGAKRYHGNRDLPDDFYGEWEIGSYVASWRVAREGRILCGSQDGVESRAELNHRLTAVELGRVMDVRRLTDFDIRVDLDNAVHIDFLGTMSDDDETFHVFGPDSVFIQHKVPGIWTMEKADQSSELS